MTGLFAQVADPNSVLLQYGALGALAILSIAAVRVLFARETKSLDLERQRADRLEAELRQLNATIQDRVVATLAQATGVMSQALEAIREDRK